MTTIDSGSSLSISISSLSCHFSRVGLGWSAWVALGYIRAAIGVSELRNTTLPSTLYAVRRKTAVFSAKPLRTMLKRVLHRRPTYMVDTFFVTEKLRTSILYSKDAMNTFSLESPQLQKIESNANSTQFPGWQICTPRHSIST